MPTDAQIAQNLDAILADSTSKGMSEADTAKRITDMWFQQGISLQRVADATRYNEADIQNILGRVSQQGAPISVPGDLGLTPTNGLAGAETALNAGLVASRNDVTTASNAARGTIQDSTAQATQQLAPFAETGVQANDRLAALNGLLGPEAQQQAFDEFRASPGQAYLTEQANNNVIGNATRIGGVGGGDVRRELLRQGAGLAAQDFGAQVGRLESTRAGGQQAATGNAQLMGNSGLAQAGIFQNEGNQLSGLNQANASQLASARLSTSQLLGNQAFQSNLQNAGFNQQNRLAGSAAIGAGGADIASQIAEAARQSGNVNINDAQIQTMLAQLGINTVPGLMTGRSDVLGAGQLAGANQAGQTGMAAITGYLGGGGLSGAAKTVGKSMIGAT